MTLSDKIRALCGYIENETQSAVKIFQDDATQTWHVYVDGKSFYSDTFQSVIEEAYAYFYE